MFYFDKNAEPSPSPISGIFQRSYTYLVDGVPLLDSDLLWSGADLRGDELLQVADRVVFVALHPYL